MNVTADPVRQKKIDVCYTMIAFVLGSIASTVIVLTILPFLGLLNSAQQSAEAEGNLKPIFYAAALVFAFGGSFVPRLMKPVGSSMSSMESLTSALKSFNLIKIIQFVIFESVAVMGFALVFLSGNNQAGLGFSVISLLAMAFNWPTKSQLTEFVNKTSS